jgi:GNAT superfamily N-acetyltransferase
MELAYAGTVDDDLGGNSDGAVEVAGWRAAGALAEVSVAVVDTHDKLLAASMCSGSWDREVWISYVITEPAWKGQGLGAAAVAESIRLVRERSGVDVFAEVTDGNVPSERGGCRLRTPQFRLTTIQVRRRRGVHAAADSPPPPRTPLDAIDKTKVGCCPRPFWVAYHVATMHQSDMRGYR